MALYEGAKAATTAGEGRRSLAERAAAEAKSAVERSHLDLYALRVNQAAAACAQQRTGRTAELLDACRPEDRGWEWQYLDRQRRAIALDFKGHSGVVRGVAYSPDNRHVASASHDRSVRIGRRHRQGGPHP